MRWFRRSGQGRHAAPRYQPDATVRAAGPPPPPFRLMNGAPLPDTLILPAVCVPGAPPVLIQAARAASWRGDPVTVDLPGRRVIAVVIGGDPDEWMDAISRPLPASPVTRFEKAPLPEGLLAWTEHGEGHGGTVVVSTRVDSITGADAARAALRAARRQGYRIAALSPLAALRWAFRTPWHAVTASAGAAGLAAATSFAVIAVAPHPVATLPPRPTVVVHHHRGRRPDRQPEKAPAGKKTPMPIITPGPLGNGSTSPDPSPSPDPPAPTGSPVVSAGVTTGPAPSVCVSLLITGVCVGV